ncbi:MAG: hypothetical protein PHU53_07760 [Thermoplasmata archaeon]|jgi:hypothetical protein|nr:hypothetical protein [Thermoplasmata archaeon]
MREAFIERKRKVTCAVCDEVDVVTQVVFPGEYFPEVTQPQGWLKAGEFLICPKHKVVIVIDEKVFLSQ